MNNCKTEDTSWGIFLLLKSGIAHETCNVILLLVICTRFSEKAFLCEEISVFK